jgi:hypothetical protein
LYRGPLLHSISCTCCPLLLSICLVPRPSSPLNILYPLSPSPLNLSCTAAPFSS